MYLLSTEFHIPSSLYISVYIVSFVFGLNDHLPIGMGVTYTLLYRHVIPSGRLHRIQPRKRISTTTVYLKSRYFLIYCLVNYLFFYLFIHL